ncbi:hypothetical protein HY642_06650 [Candidatus Woesearchaeota archaeon]|nr:hypothetical protein [Candidatus Woesearchaeota archaeon]
MPIAEAMPRIAEIAQYRGEWIVVCNSKVVAHGKDLTKLRGDIDSCKRTPLIAKIPKEEILIF